MMSDWTVSDAYSEQKSDLLALELGNHLFETLNKQTPLARQVQQLRQNLIQSHGFYVPAIRIKTTATSDDEYVIRLRGQRVGQAVLYPSLCFSTETEKEAGIRGVHPVTQQPGFWHEGEGIPAHELLLSHVKSVMEQKAPELLTYESVARWLQQAKSHVPNLLKELEKRGVTVGLIWQIMRKLLAQRIPLHPFEDLLETIMEYYVMHPPGGYAPPEWSQSHPDDIVKYIASKKKKRLPNPGQTTAKIRHLNR